MFAKLGVRRNASHGRSIRGSRLLLLATATVMGIVLVVGVVLAAAVTIDTFDEGEQLLDAHPGAPTVSSVVASTTQILGHERDARVDWLSGGGHVTLNIDEWGTTNQLKFSEQSGVMGTAQVVWDGEDGDALTIDKDGLEGVDLTDNGTNDGFQLLLYEADSGYDLVATVYSNTNEAVYTLTLAAAVSPPGYSFFMPFQDFVGDQIVFTSTGAIVFDIEPPGANVDLTIDLFEATAETDWGDLPEATTNYSTTLANDGPRHVKGDLYLGSTIDLEADGFPSASADGDDNNNYADEDGIERNPNYYPWQLGKTVHITATVNGAGGYLVGWFDWNNDGDLDDSGEMEVFGTVNNGENDLEFTVDNAYTTGQDLYARFRLYDGNPGTPQYSGEVTNGEVEDYKWEFEPTAVTLTRLDVTSVPPRSPVGAAAAALAVLTCGAAVGGALMRRRRAR
jgi:hypothetical protein